MHICHIISGDLWAGAEVMACQLLKSLHLSQDIKLSVLLMNDGRLASELRKAGIQVLVISEQDNSFIKILLTAFRLFSHNPPDIFHAHRYKENFLAYLLSILIGSHLVTTQHGLPEIKKKSFVATIINCFNFFLLRFFFHQVVAVSEDIKSFFVDEYYFEKRNVVTVHNGVYLPAASQHEFDFSRFVIGSAGRFFPVKDYYLLVSVAKFLSHEAGVSFVLAGEGPQKESLEKLIKDSLLQDRFHLVGHKDNMESFYSGLNVYINTSIHEGIPMTILEAMARGLPIIAPRVGGIPEVVDDGVQGFLIDGRDPEVFAEKCLLLYNDRELWQRMSLAAREKTERCFSVEKMAQGYLEIYRKLCGERC